MLRAATAVLKPPPLRGLRAPRIETEKVGGGSFGDKPPPLRGSRAPRALRSGFSTKKAGGGGSGGGVPTPGSGALKLSPRPSAPPPTAGAPAVGSSSKRLLRELPPLAGEERGASLSGRAGDPLRPSPSTSARAANSVPRRGDAASSITGMITGEGLGAAFAAAHCVAIALYLRNPRERNRPFDKLVAIALFAITPMVAWLLSGDLLVMAYAALLGAMAAAAFLSRFPRGRVATGAALFVLSDWLIFSRMGPTGDSSLAEWMIWPLYYSGQFLIATGVIQTMRGELRAG